MAPAPFPPAGYSEDVAKRVRALFAGQFVVDSEHPKFVWENAYWPVYYVPRADVKEEYLANGKEVENGTQFDLVAGGETEQGAVTVFEKGEFSGWVKVTHREPVIWFEEEERIWIHPRDPYKRVTILKSSKHIRVEVDGVEVANTTNSFRLYETGFPIRTYIPPTDVRLDLLAPSDKQTACPYKGDASYYDLKLPSGETKSGIVWWYKSPILESVEIKGHIAFYDEKVDVWVDDIKQAQPVTRYS